MRTTVIPAQITTVEDKIAGNLSLTQILLFIFQVFWMAIVYSLIFPFMQFTWYKLPVVGIVTLFSLTLAIRFKGKILIEWLIVIIRYNLRPSYWVFNKNETEGRLIDCPVIHSPTGITHPKVPITTKAIQPQTFTLMDLIRLNHFIKSKNMSVRYKLNPKGGLHVAFNQIEK